MDAQTFLDNFATIAEAPGGVQRLRDLVLALAVRGQLVDQEPADEPAAVLLDGMSPRRDALVARGAIGTPRHPEGVAVDDPPHEIPASWAWARLGDVGAVVGGGTPKSGEPAYWADGFDVPWLTPADMRSQASRLVSRGARDITARGLAESSAQLLPAGSVLFSSRAPIGHVGIAAQPLATNQGFKSCVPYVGAMTEYLYLFLRYIGPIVDASATGTTFKEVSGKQVALIPVPVPPLAEQERIVAKTDELMELCDDLEARQERRHRATTRFRSSTLHALTEAQSPEDLLRAWERVSAHWSAVTDRRGCTPVLRQVIMQLGLSGRLVASHRDDEPVEHLLEQIQACREALPRKRGRAAPEQDEPSDGLEGSLPRGWAEVSLGEITQIVRGITFPASAKHQSLGPDLVPCLRTANVQAAVEWDDLIFVPKTYVKDPAQMVRPGDLLMSMANSRELVGKVALVDPNPPEAAFGGFLAVLRPLVVSPRFLQLVLQDPRAKPKLIDSATQTTNIANISLGRLRPFRVPLPPLAEQERIVACVDSLMALSDRLDESLNAAEQLQASLGRSLAPV